MRVQLMGDAVFNLAGNSGSIMLKEASIIGASPGDYPIGQIANFAATAFMLPLDAAGISGVTAAGGPRPLRVSTATTSLATSAATAAGSAVLTFSAVPAASVPPILGSAVSNLTTPAVLPPGTVLNGKTGTTATLSANATGAGVASGDVIMFGGYLPPSWSGPIPAYFGGTGPNWAAA